MDSSPTFSANSGAYLYPGPELRHVNEIRLIRLLPGSGPIECEFLAADITTRPSYEALSYTWGDPLERREILVRSPSTFPTTTTTSRLSVTTNCLAALYNLRTAELRQLWIDAICIDQSNLGERHHQLSLMGGIYTAATCVVIFLGEAGDDSDVAMDYIRDLHSPPTCLPSAPELADNERLYKAVKRLFGKPWFQRVCVMQEALMASEATVMCGEKTFPWAAVKDMCAVAANPPTRDPWSSRKASLETKDIPFVAGAKKRDFGRGSRRMGRHPA